MNFDYLRFVAGTGKSASLRRGRFSQLFEQSIFGTPSAARVTRAEIDLQPSASRGLPERAVRGVIAGEATFTLNLTFAGDRFRLKGTFGLDGDATFGTAASPFHLLEARNGSKKELRMRLDESTLEGVIVCTLSDPGGGNDFSFNLAPALSTNRPNPRPFTRVPDEILGSYTFELPAETPANTGLAADKYPQAPGWGRLTVKPSGVIKGSGKLADGTPFSFTTTLLDDLAASFSVSTHRGAGSFVGTFAFREESDPNDLDADDFAVLWTKPAKPTAALYPEGWPNGIPLLLRGSKYVVPPKTPPTSVFPGLAATDADGNAAVTLSGGGLATTLTEALNIDPKNKVSVITAAADRFKATVIKGNGGVGGSFVHDTSAKNTRFSGVVLQKQGRIGGFFLGPAASGALLIEPSP